MIMIGMEIIGILIGIGVIGIIPIMGPITDLIMRLFIIGRFIGTIRTIRHIHIMEGAFTILLAMLIGLIGLGRAGEGAIVIGVVEADFWALLVGSEMLKKGC